ncbi:hypothetical protein HII13_002064 [Brettanomyces bruxellensis]|uniref:DEBR0S5_07184g1_1 n=1 Tax=Dekkera bruxellensis TaxID=5007 RepID=A0A7D9H4M0_DEKBR|nr:hypothetical protein HII13_002064 [Brettanomyces bruxellensis]VUG19609.1 DEBR0S5_07184g1_1 [Brettanomyces bruxellensis]
MYLIALSGLSYEFGSYFVIYSQFGINTQEVVQYSLDRISVLLTPWSSTFIMLRLLTIGIGKQSSIALRSFPAKYSKLGINDWRIRQFHSTRSPHLIYQPKAKKPKPNISGSGARTTKHKVTTLSDSEDALKEERLMRNRYYVKTPKFLRPFMKEIMLRPVGFGFSIVILQQFAVIVPFLLLWYWFFKSDHSPENLPKEEYDKGLDTIKRGLINLDMDAESKAKMAAAGAASYALTKAFLPVRIPVCVILAPWFDRWCLRPIVRVFTSLFKRNNIVKPRARK